MANEVSDAWILKNTNVADLIAYLSGHILK